MLSFFAQGAAIGLTAAGAPGPLLTYLISRSLSGGWRQGALVALGPLISDPFIVVTILLLLDRVPPSFLLVISLLGGMYVLYLAWGSIKQWRKGSQEIAVGGKQPIWEFAKSSPDEFSQPRSLRLLDPGQRADPALCAQRIDLVRDSIFIGFLRSFYWGHAGSGNPIQPGAPPGIKGSENPAADQYYCFIHFWHPADLPRDNRVDRLGSGNVDPWQRDQP